MSEITNGHKGMELVEEGKWDEAVAHLTKAIKVRASPAWLLARAQAYQQKGELDRALVDCEHAYVEAAQRQSSREQHMREAQYRRGVIAFRQGRLADADACCSWAMRVALGHPAREQPDPVAGRVGPDGFYGATLADAEADNRVAVELDNAGGDGKSLASASKKKEWVRPHSFRVVVLGHMQKLPADAPARRLTVTREPKPPALVDGEYKPEQAAAASSATPSAKTAPATTAPATAAAAPKEQKLRIDHFQNKEVVTLSIFVKGADKDKVTVERAGSDVVVVRNIPRESNPDLVLKLSHGVSAAGEIKHKVFGTKIELTLLNGTPGQKWTSWGSELTGPDAAAAALAAAASSAGAPAAPDAPTAAPAAPAAPAAADKPPAYPTSAKGGPKDWEKLGGDEADEDKEQDVNDFFKTLYKNAAPEARRAMMKSYVESNGTHLSTDWAGVKDAEVPTHPPDGAEVKKW
ncbi:hypothetical protein RB595_007530 [Gaeumannomyces hyphopodioides]